MSDNITNTIEKVTAWLPVLGHHLVTLVVVAAVLLVGLVLLFLLTRLWDWTLLMRQKSAFLEITPPASADRTPLQVKELFTILHGINTLRSIRERMLRKRLVMSLEVTGTKSRGVRYIAKVPEKEADAIRHAITAHLSSARVRPTKDYVPQTLNSKNTRILDFRQQKPYYLPLKTQTSFTEHDPFAYLNSAMAELEDDEQIAFQVVLKPAIIRDAAIIAQKILRNDDLLTKHSGRSPFKMVFGGIFKLISGVMYFVTDFMHSSAQTSVSVTNPQRQHQQQVDMKIKPARSINAAEQEVNSSINEKVHQPLFRAEVRALITADNKDRRKLRTKALNATISAFDTNYQSLRARHNFPIWLKGRYRLFMFQRRLPAFFGDNSNILSAAEVADLYHFPALTTSSENVVQSLSRTLPATLALKRGTDVDVVIGRSNHQGQMTAIGLSAAERARHVYVVGATGNGKTTMMLYAIIQDIKNGKGVAVFDPHGDMALELLQHIPKERLNDVIYFDPDDLEYPVGFNLLELDPSLEGDDLERAKYLITEYTVEIFRKLFSDDDSGGSRIEAVLRNAIYTAFTTKDPTLFTIYQLITDKDFRKKVVEKLDDEVLKNFWNNEFDQGGEYQRVKMGFGVTTKVGRFLTAVFVRRVMDQPKSTIDFDDIVNNGKILICNFSKGNLVKATSTLFGTSILARLQLAGQRRGKMREKDRRPFYIYIDEFQNFATSTFVEMLAEARKYGLHMFMAEQSTSQQDRDVVYNILNNAGTVVSFSTGNPMDEQLLLPRFQPWVGVGEIANLPSYNFFARIKPIGASDSQTPVSGETIPLNYEYDEAKEKRVIAASRANYAKKYVPVTRSKAAGATKTKKSGKISNPTTEQR